MPPVSRTIPSSPFPKRRKPLKSGIKRGPQRVFPRHRKHVRSHHCVVPGCDRYDIECCHIRSAFDAGTGLKPPDWRTFPACAFHHAEQHRIGQGSFEDKYGLDLDGIAQKLARHSPDTNLRLAMLEALLDEPVPTIPVYVPQPKRETSPHVDADLRRSAPDVRLAHPGNEGPRQPNSEGDDRRGDRARDGAGAAVAAEGRAAGMAPQISGEPGRGSSAILRHAELAGLTARQALCLRTLQRLFDSLGHAPSVRELADAIGTTHSNTHRLLDQLKSRGYVRSTPGRNRSLTILRRVPVPAGIENAAAPTPAGRTSAA